MCELLLQQHPQVILCVFLHKLAVSTQWGGWSALAGPPAAAGGSEQQTLLTLCRALCACMHDPHCIAMQGRSTGVYVVFLAGTGRTSMSETRHAALPGGMLLCACHIATPCTSRRFHLGLAGTAAVPSCLILPALCLVLVSCTPWVGSTGHASLCLQFGVLQEAHGCVTPS